MLLVISKKTDAKQSQYQAGARMEKEAWSVDDWFRNTKIIIILDCQDKCKNYTAIGALMAGSG